MLLGDHMSQDIQCLLVGRLFKECEALLADFVHSGSIVLRRHAIELNVLNVELSVLDVLDCLVGEPIKNQRLVVQIYDDVIEEIFSNLQRKF